LTDGVSIIGKSWAPQNMGNRAGQSINDTMEPVSKYTGPALEKAGGVLGGVTGPTVGAIGNFGKAWGEQLGVGHGNEGGGPAKQQEAEAERMKEPVGGKEQNAGNPLGLNNP
jgi:hypothetical protein